MERDKHLRRGSQGIQFTIAVLMPKNWVGEFGYRLVIVILGSRKSDRIIGPLDARGIPFSVLDPPNPSTVNCNLFG